MTLNYKSAAVLIVLAAALVAGAYTLGLQQSGQQARGTSAANTSAGRIDPQAPMPSDHPSIEDAGNSSAAAVNAKFTHFRVGNRNVKSIQADGKYVWIGTSGGVIRYDTTSRDYKIYNNETDGILSNGVFHVNKLGDRLILGTYGGGMSVLDTATGQWRNYNIPDGLADQFVYEVIEDKHGDVWIATWSGVNKIEDGDLEDPAKWEMFTVENTDGGLPNPWVYGVEEGQDGAMWFATEEGLARYQDGQWTNWQHEDGLGVAYEKVKDTIQSTSDPGKASKHHSRLKQEQGLGRVNVAYNPNYIISLDVDDDGVVWCGTWGAGLARFDGETWRNFTTEDGLPANHIFMLYRDAQDRLWIGTNHGLARLNEDGETFSTLTTADGLFADNVFSMDFDEEGTVWIGSFGGVSHLNAKL